MWQDSPPWERGNTFYNGNAPDPNDLYPDVQREGKEYFFNDTIYGTGVPIKARMVRNDTGGLVYPGRLYRYKPGYRRQRVDRATVVANEEGVPLDELLPAAGVQDKDLVYAIVAGPCLIYLPDTPSAGLVIALGDQVVATTAATSGAPDAGSISVGNTVGSTALANGVIGRAMSAATTGNTHTGLLVMRESLW